MIDIFVATTENKKQQPSLSRLDEMIKYLLRTQEKGCLNKEILHDIYLRLLDINQLISSRSCQ